MEEMDMTLHPTLWRTCRVLAGPTRLKLLRLVVSTPGKTVSRLAEDAGIGLSRASQELRRLQSRGLLQTDRKGPFVHYLPEPDPLVPDAKPLLLALKATFARTAASKDAQIPPIAAALSHPRRILILRELCEGPRTIPMLQASLHMSFSTLFQHLRTLERGHLVQRQVSVYRLARLVHPLAKCLLERVKTPKSPRTH
jgi:DNA-binding transcriptional ArsR family regulator